MQNPRRAVAWSLFGAVCLQILSIAQGQPAEVAQMQLGIVGNVAEGGGSCGYSFANNTVVTSGAFQGSIDANNTLLAGLPSAGCGSCIRITCNVVGNQAACRPGADPVLLVVTDSCPTCALNLPLQAFNQIADSYLGSVNVQGQLVPCPAAGNLVTSISTFRPQNDGGSYIKLTISNAAGSGSYRSVELRSSRSQGRWMAMSNTFGASWEASSLPVPPMDMRLTRADGQSVIAKAVLGSNPAGNIDLGVNFPGGAARPAALAPTPLPGAGAPTAQPSVSQVEHLARDTPLKPTYKRRSLLQITLFDSSFSLEQLLQAFYPNSVITLATPPPPEAPAPLSIVARPPPAPLGIVVQPLPTPSPSRTPRPTPAVVAALPPIELPPPSPQAPPVVPPTESAAPQVAPVAAPAAAPEAAPVATPSAGPLQLAPALAPGAECREITDWIEQSPSLSVWYDLLQSTGYTNSLNQPNVSVTMFAPINSAFSSPIFTGTTVGKSNNVSTVSELVGGDPSSAQPLIGYHVLKGVFTAADLRVGESLNTTDTLKQFGAPDRTLAITIPAANQINGIGSTAAILKADLQACGPSVLHVVDQVLLPFYANSNGTSSSSAASPPATEALPRATGR